MAIRAVPTATKRTRLIDVPVIGWVAGYQPDQGLLVDFPGNPGPPVAARTTLELDTRLAEEAAVRKAPIVLVFENGEPGQPIVMGWVKATTNLAPPQALGPTFAKGLPGEAFVDGRRIVINGEDEVLLRCGKASIELKRSGAVIIKGAHLISHSSGVNRIRGGSVQLN